MDPLGGNVAHLTTTPNHDGDPVWSWNNKQIALTRYRRDNSNILRQDIYLINADGSNGHWARPYNSTWSFWDPAWSPDGSRIVVSIHLSDGNYLGWINLATGGINLFSPAVKGSKPSYDPTGQRIVFVGSAEKTIEQINADGSGRKTRYTSTTFVNHPTFSPDGKKIAFERKVSFNSEIFVKNLTTGTTQRLTYSSATDFSPSWSPDGTRIVFASDRVQHGTFQIYTMSPTGTNVVRIKTASGDWEPASSH
jgi:TolB protein